MLKTERKYTVLGATETENFVLYTLHKLRESDYLELSNVIYVLDTLLTREEGKRLPFLKGSISNERGVVMRGLADTIECLSIEKKVELVTARSEFCKLKPEVERAIRKIEEKIKKEINENTFKLYIGIIDKLLETEDREKRFEKSVKYALNVCFSEDAFFETLTK